MSNNDNSKSSNTYRQEHKRNNYDNLMIYPPRGTAQELNVLAKALGFKSRNDYLLECIRSYSQHMINQRLEEFKRITKETPAHHSTHFDRIFFSFKPSKGDTSWTSAIQLAIIDDFGNEVLDITMQPPFSLCKTCNMENTTRSTPIDTIAISHIKDVFFNADEVIGYLSQQDTPFLELLDIPITSRFLFVASKIPDKDWIAVPGTSSYRLPTLEEASQAYLTDYREGDALVQACTILELYNKLFL